MSRSDPSAERGSPERELLEALAARFALHGYRTYLDPDGSDYFDLAVKQGEEVGLIEGKVGRPTEVLAQALRRRPWGTWVGVAVDSPRAADRLVRRTQGHRSGAVGVWSVLAGRVLEHRAPTAWNDDTGAFGATREVFLQRLVDLDLGRVPRDVRWSGVPGDVRRVSRGRGFAEWRLDETGPPPP